MALQFDPDIRARGSRRSGGWLLVELAAWMTAVLCLATWTYRVVSGEVGRRAAIHWVDTHGSARPSAVPDQRLWSPQRVLAWQESTKQEAPPPLGILRLRAVGLEVPILEGTDDWTLNRAVGHIADTSTPGAPGNCAIAGHRDGFFRSLKDVRAGEEIEVQTPRGLSTYRIERTWIVQPDDVSVLDPTGADCLTLVTCYPFYFVGSAPERFIVRAVRISR